MMKWRVGYGEDIHRLVPDKRLIICGIELPFHMGLEGHSDADVGYHAVSDAILGALALGDIGKYFPPSDEQTEGIDSAIIVSKCVSLMRDKGYTINNVDVIIYTEAPKLRNYIDLMRESLAKVLECDVDAVSIKAKTNEKLDAVGMQKAIRSSAIVSLVEE